jgi:molybdopterin-guanine dinucleotide biosynthesis protein A
LKVSGCLLAGGRSRRFGEDKRFFKFKGKTLTEISVEKLKKVFDEACIICDDENFIRKRLKKVILIYNIQLIEDIEKYKGPLTGIYSFFKKTDGKSGFFMPCDMPYLPVEFMRYFVGAVSKSRYMILISEEKPLPLFMNSFFISELGNYLKNQNSIKGFIKLIKDKYPEKIYFIPEKELLTFGNPKEYLKNINTKEDLI